MFCMKCGKPMDEGAKFCAFCGTAAPEPAAPVQEQAPVQPQPVAAPVVEQPAPEPVVEQPAPQEPVAPPQPVFEEPAPQPVVEQPAPQQPVFEQPVFEQPVYQQPVYQQPVWQEAPQQTAAPQPSQDTFVLNTPETAGKKKKKKNKLLIAIIAAVTAVAVAVGGIVGWPYISNFFNKTFSSPEDYNKNTVTSTVADPDGALVSAYGSLRTALLNMGQATDAAGEGTLRLQMDETFLTSMLAAVFHNTDLDADDLAFLKDISFKVDSNVKGSAMECALTAVLGNTDIITMEVGMDFEEGTMWFRFPELSDEYVIADMYDDLDMDMDWDEMEESMAMVSQLAQVLPEEEVLIRLLEKYIPLAMAEITDVEEESVTLKTGGIEQSVTAVTSEIDYETLLNMAIACLEEVQDDKDIEKICNDIDAYYEDNMGYSMNIHDMLTESVPQLIEELEGSLEYADEMEGSVEVTTYVDGKGKLTGLAVEMGRSKFVDMYIVRDGDKFAVCLEFPEGEIELTGEGTDKKGIINATYELEYSGTKLGKLEVKNFDSEGLTKGTLILTPDEELFEMIAGGSSSAAVSGLISAQLGLELSFSGSEKDASFSIAILGGSKDMIRLSMDAKTKTPTAIKAPSDGISMSDDDAGIAWVESWDIDAVLDNLRKAGVPSDLMDLLEAAMEQGFSGSDSDIYYDDDYENAYDEEYEFSYGTGTVTG